MPYSAVSQLPEAVKNALPSGAEHIFLRAFDAAFSQYHDEERAMKIAWGAVKNAGFHKNAEGNWVKADADFGWGDYQLPDAVKRVLPDAAAAIFKAAFNAAWDKYHEEERSLKIAWAAVKNAGYAKNKDDSWVKMDDFGPTKDPMNEEDECGCDGEEDCECIEVMPARKKKRKYDSVIHFDRVELLNKPKKTSQGFLQVGANVSRTGVFTYRNPDGSKRRELRLPEEVFSEKALETLKSAPVTLDHPIEKGLNVMVTPENAKKFSVGVLGENIDKDEKFISANLLIMDAQAISEVEKKRKREVSLGYTCKLDFSPGTWKGEEYDAIQRDIVYNHAAIVSRGRAGSDVRIRMDSFSETEYSQPIRKENLMETIIMKLDGVDYELPNQTAQAFSKAMERSDAEKVALKAELEATKGKFDVLSAELKKAEQARMDSSDPAKFDAAVLTRVNLLAQATKILGSDEGLNGLSSRQIKEKVLNKLDPEAKFDTATDDYINGGFDLVCKNHRERNDSVANVRKAVEETAKTPSNVQTKDAVKARWANAWKNNK